MIKIKRFVFSPFAENTFVMYDEFTKETAVIDPGCADKNEEDELRKFINDNDLKVKFLINTHCHIDHIFGCAFVKENYDVKYFAPEADLPLLENAVNQAQMFGASIKPPPKPDEFITEDLKLKFGESEMEFLFTPGHTPGEYCIYLPDQKDCITGDVLFQNGIGRTDLWGGDYEQLMNSINEKLLTLPDDVKIYPGHGNESTIGDEKIMNPFLKD